MKSYIQTIIDTIINKQEEISNSRGRKFLIIPVKNDEYRKYAQVIKMYPELFKIYGITINLMDTISYLDEFLWTSEDVSRIG